MRTTTYIYRIKYNVGDYDLYDFCRMGRFDVCWLEYKWHIKTVAFHASHEAYGRFGVK